MKFNDFLPLEGLTWIASVCFICKRETHSDSQSPRQAGRRTARHHPDPARLLASSPHPPSTGCAVCARGPGHLVWVLTVSYPGGRTKQISLSAEQKTMVQQWLRNYRKLKATLERICELNQQLLRPEKKA